MRHVTTIQEHLGYPSGALGSALQAERRLSLVYLGGQDPAVRASLESQRLVTDRQMELLRRLADARKVRDVTNAEQKRWTAELLGRLDTLDASRRSIDSGSVGRTQAFATYTQILASVDGLQASLSTLRDPEVARDADNQVMLMRLREVLSQEDALLAGALAAHRVTGREHADFIMLVGLQRFGYDAAGFELRPADQAYYRRITSSPEFRKLRAMEDRVVQQHVGGGPPAPRQNARDAAHAAGTRGSLVPPVNDVEWKTTTSSILTKLRGLELASAASAEERAKPIADGIIRRIMIGGGFGIAAILAMVILSFWVGRSVIRELTRLKRAALELASERLPSVIRRLRRGEDVDVAAEAPSLSFNTDEIDQVGQAFNAARRTAIQGAVEEAKLRRSISDVFINLARRNQALLHRQLSLLDTMERRVADPDELEDLFRLDHLATRMRRHAEGLIILSGQAPGRGWRNPVPAVDVVRAAAAEVEDYARVTVTPMPRVAVSGKAVADLIHLLAELIENATLFSPPHTTVQVSGQLVAHGFAVEIEDRGLSMDPAALAAANERLADPPEFDLSSSARLGLFVVGRLAKRHSIQVTLRTSPYGGTTAIVLVPAEIVVRNDGFQIDGRPPALTRRAEESLIPVGAIGAGDVSQAGSSWFDPSAPPQLGPTRPERTTYQQPAQPLAGNGRSGRPGERPPLPQRRPGSSAQPLSSPPMSAQPMSPQAMSPPAIAPQSMGGQSMGGQPRGSQPMQPMWQPPPQRPRPPQSPSSPPPGDGSFADRATAPPPSAAQPPEPPATVPRQAPSAFTPAGPAAEEAEADTDRPVLPRRVRQANLAPQLRDEEMTDPGIAAAESTERSPEELRTMLGSIQKGWLRGRSAAEQIDEEQQEDQ